HKKSSESLYRINTINSELTVKIGRDILMYGDFENHAVDDEAFDAPRWDTSGESSFVSVANAMKGVAGLSSTRSSSNLDLSSIAFRNRIRVTGDVTNTPLKDLSFFGYLKGDNAGRTQLKVRYHASIGVNTFGEEYFDLTQGSHDWLAQEVVLNMPADDPLYPNDPENNARALRLFLQQDPPATGNATISYDELALINWEISSNLTSTLTFTPVNQYDFIKIIGVPGSYQLSITVRSYEPLPSKQKKSFPWVLFVPSFINR
ncbi:MAG: hypothetical protein D3910_27295, partial [Candidatus Electrothrix sp. ATG2]|nr:hypothetical protein [Candidatus Electrothrix sp. ATG2]